MSHQRPRVLFLAKYARNGASSRYRIFEYLPCLQRAGLDCSVEPLFDELYLIHRYQTGQGHFSDIARAFLHRLMVLVSVRRFDLVVIEKEIFPYFSALPERWLGWLNMPYVVDYDDALFHQYDQHKSRWIRLLLGRKIARVMRGAHLVTAGNAYLADYAYRAGAPKVEVIPTVIDLVRYPEGQPAQRHCSTFTIGWIGSPSTAKYLTTIAPALAESCLAGRARVHLIGSGKIDIPGVPVELLPWNEATEVDAMRQFDVGIMPLPDAPWERGKCGFKLIQYMACGLPVVASPVGVNSEIVEHGVNGFLANSQAEWIEALDTLRRDVALRQRMGEAGRRKVEDRYALQVTAPRLAAVLKSILEPEARVCE